MKRVPGKYLVWAFVGVVTTLFVVALILAINLTPAAERFQNRSVPSEKR